MRTLVFCGRTLGLRIVPKGDGHAVRITSGGCPTRFLVGTGNRNWRKTASPSAARRKIGWEAWTRTRIARSRVWSPTNWTTSQHRINTAHCALRARLCGVGRRSEEHTSELQSRRDLVCRLLLEKKKQNSALPLTNYTCNSC